MSNTSAALLCALLVAAGESYAHPGGLNAEGCHNNRKTGDYHCHRAPVQSQAKPDPTVPPSSTTTGAQSQSLPPGCYVGPRGGTYTITKTGKKNYSGC
ncbi:YHYH domain-containing protein [Roseateles sp.]|jgi:hypothetical protein|uniref:YHYH domain-containing protein n=1 Tax=Roseateles sp. TaxID=1971397 RepID=UPI0037C615C5